jgi:hypothetical protein
MEYFTKDIFLVDDYQDTEEFEDAENSYKENLANIDLLESIQQLLDDEHWSNNMHFVDDMISVPFSRTLNFILDNKKHLFIVQYRDVESSEVIQPTEEEAKEFQADRLEMLAQEWGKEDDKLTHSFLLNNGYMVKIKMGSLKYWKTKIVFNTE